MKIIKLFLIFTFSSFLINAQKELVQITHERKNDNSINFLYNCNNHGYYYVKLKFPFLQNSSYFSKGHNIYGHLGTLIKLKPIKIDQPINFQYSYVFWKGKGLKDYKNMQQHLMPYNEGKKVRVNYVNHLNQIIEKKVPDSWIAYGFNSSAPDSIIATRKGMVVEVTNSYKNDTTTNFIYTKSRNEIIVEHEDGTLGKYVGFEFNKINVKAGDAVFPGSFLGVVGREGTDPENYQLIFSLYYLNIGNMTSEGGSDGQFGINYTCVAPKFYNEEKHEHLVPGIYEVKHDQNIIMSEMSKKEKKQFLEKASK